MFTRILLSLGCLGLLFALVAGCSDNAPQQGGDGTVTFSVFDRNAQQTVTPTWIAFQDGPNGVWTPLAGSGPYTVPVTDAAGAYGFAFVVDDGSPVVHMLHGTLSDASDVVYPVWADSQQLNATRRAGRTRFSPAARPTPITPWTQNGTAENIPADMEFMSVASPLSSGAGFDYTNPVSLHYYWEFLAGTLGDGAVLFGDIDGNGDIPGALYLQRDLNEPAGTSLTNQNIDFTPPYSAGNGLYLCTRQTFTVPDADNIFVSLITVNDMRLALGGGNASSASYFTPPASALLETDRYRFYAKSYANDTWMECLSGSPIASQSLPAAFTCTMDQSDGYLFQGLTHPTATVFVIELESDTNTEWEVNVTLAWLQAAGATEYALPDFAGNDVAGWQPAWNPTGPFWRIGVIAESYTGSFADYFIRGDDNISTPDITIKSAECVLLNDE